MIIKIVSVGCILLVLGFLLSLPSALKYGNMCPDSKLLELETRIDMLERNMEHAKRLLRAREPVQ